MQRPLGGSLPDIDKESEKIETRKEVLILSDQFLQRPQEFLERIVRLGNGSSISTDHDTGVAVITCSDPRLADVIKGRDARFIRIPGVEVDPQWAGVHELMRSVPRVVLFLCHDQCVAHGGRLEMAQGAVQKARQTFSERYGRAGGAWLAGKVDVASGHITLLDESGEAWEPEKLLHTLPIHSGKAMRPLLELNRRRSTPSNPRGTTLLHPPIGVLAISVAGALNDMRERNLAYVIDWVEQDEEALAKQVRLLGNVCLINAPVPHLCVAAPAEQAEEAYAILAYARSVISDMERGDRFTAELVVRLSSGSFASIPLRSEVVAGTR